MPPDVITTLTGTDLIPYIRDKVLQQIIDDDDSIVQDASDTAKAIVRDFLYSIYDVDTILGDETVPGDLNKYLQVKRWISVITIYFIYERIPDKVTPKRVVKNYDDVMAWLQKIASGEIPADLPRQVDEETDTPLSNFRWGSAPRREH